MGIEGDRIAYVELLERSRQRSVFAEPWWLDAATGSLDGWSANVLLGDDGSARAAWPMPIRAERAGAVATGAPYTPFLGPLLPDREPGVARVSADVDLLEQLATQLAGQAHVEAACMPELDYWTPLSWHGFEQTTRTTWRIAASATRDSVRAGMRKGTRSTLNAAERDGLVVGAGTIEELLDACAATFERQDGADVPNAAVLERVARAALQRERGEILAIRTPAGELASAGLFVWDDRFTWNLANGRVAHSTVTGAPTLLLWHAIGAALDRGTGFDFEGSMLQPVERFVRGFGGEPVAYSVVRRSSPAWAKTVMRKRRAKRLLRR
ncbi:MAG: putative methicillin resistance protein [Thermoleophilia bacterium]|nr:putative methicillin resistance protein [Thermoleophilia bacterium]